MVPRCMKQRIITISIQWYSAEQFFEAVGSVSRLHKVRNYNSTGWLNSALGPSAESPSYSLESDLPLQYSTVQVDHADDLEDGNGLVLLLLCLEPPHLVELVHLLILE